MPVTLPEGDPVPNEATPAGFPDAVENARHRSLRSAGVREDLPCELQSALETL